MEAMTSSMLTVLTRLDTPSLYQRCRRRQTSDQGHGTPDVPVDAQFAAPDLRRGLEEEALPDRPPQHPFEPFPGVDPPAAEHHDVAVEQGYRVDHRQSQPAADLRPGGGVVQRLGPHPESAPDGVAAGQRLQAAVPAAVAGRTAPGGRPKA